MLRTIVCIAVAFALGAPAQNAPEPATAWKSADTPSGRLEIHPNVSWIEKLPLGPFARLDDGAVLAVNDAHTLTSRDDGVTWESHPLFTQDQPLKVSSERALLRTASGTLVLVFMNYADRSWEWIAEKSLPAPGARLPVWSIRSLDDGRTWVDAQMIYDGYSGDIHHMIQTRSGHIIAPVQELLYEDGRHALRPQISTDDGKTWKRTNLLDIGGRGHHDGIIEATLAELRDGRVWMLSRTNLGRFWSAWSDDNGEHWRILEPSDIPASSAPGTLTRLQSGRLMLVWNRPTPDGADTAPPETMAGGDNQWSDVRASNYRAELSVAFSDDDGASWSNPVVIARKPDAPRAYLAYSYVFEATPGIIWVTTMQGDVRVAFREAELVQPMTMTIGYSSE